MKLYLEAGTREERRIKAYLEANASGMLAEKINNGVRIQKDGRTLLNKKTLKGFMKYAAEEAKKLAGKGAHAACVEDDVVYGWAVHYFEEDAIEGTLCNEDGTEYKITPQPAAETPAVKRSPSKPQLSMFDLMEEGSAEAEHGQTENISDESSQPAYRPTDGVPCKDLEPEHETEEDALCRRIGPYQTDGPVRNGPEAFKEGSDEPEPEDLAEAASEEKDSAEITASQPFLEADATPFGDGLKRSGLAGSKLHSEERISQSPGKGAVSQQKPFPGQESEQAKPLSPVYRTYLEVQRKYPRAIVVMRLGDFYEVFGEHARTLAKELRLTLTDRDCGLPERVPMVGFPCHTADVYFDKLIRCGHPAVVLEGEEVRELPSAKDIDLETGEVLSGREDRSSDGPEDPDSSEGEDWDLSAFDKEVLALLDGMFGGEITVR